MWEERYHSGSLIDRSGTAGLFSYGHVGFVVVHAKHIGLRMMSKKARIRVAFVWSALQDRLGPASFGFCEDLITRAHTVGVVVLW